MSVVTIYFLVAVYLSFIAVCAPNQRADTLLSSIHAHVESDLSIQAASRAKTLSTKGTVDSSHSHEPLAVSKNDLASLSSSAFSQGTGVTFISSTTGSGNLQSSAAGGVFQAQAAPSQGHLPSITSGPRVTSTSSDLRIASVSGNLLYNITSVGGSSTVVTYQPNQSQGTLSIISGTGNNWGNSTVNGLQPYPSPGAPFPNATSASQGDSIGTNGKSGEGTGCPLPQTVTLPPITVTAPAQTVTVTAAPETTTITVAPQIQTQTVTVTVTITITAGPAPPYPTDTGSPGTGQIAAPPNAPGTAQVAAPSSGPGPGQTNAPSNLPGSGQSSATPNLPNTAGLNASAAGPVPLVNSGENTQGGGTQASQLPNQTGGGPVTSPSSPQYLSIPATLASELNRIPLFSPTPAGSPIISRYEASLRSSTGLSPSSAAVGPFSAPYQNTTGGSGFPISNSAGTAPAAGPTVPGAASPSAGPTAPAPYPGSLYRIHGGIGNATVAIGALSTGSSSSAGVNYTNTAPSVNLGPVHPFTGLPAGPSITPLPSVNDSKNAQAPPLSPFSPDAACSINNTSTQNITADVKLSLPLLPQSPNL